MRCTRPRAALVVLAASVAGCATSNEASLSSPLTRDAGSADDASTLAINSARAFDLELTMHESNTGCYLRGSIAIAGVAAQDAGTEVSNVALTVDGIAQPLLARSLATSLVDIETPNTRRRWFGLELARCPSARSARVELGDQGKRLRAQLKVGEESVYTVKLQPVVVEGNGLTAVELTPAYADRMIRCVGQIWSKKCHIALDVADAKAVAIRANEDDFILRPIVDKTNPLSPFVYSDSAQALFRDGATGRTPVFIGKQAARDGATFGNYSLPRASYEIASTPGEGIQGFQQFWFRPKAQLRTDRMFTELDPTKWQLGDAEPISLPAIIHNRNRFPVTFPHELGHILGLSHPENTLTLDDDAVHSNVMLSTGAHKRNANIADVYAESPTMDSFETQHCERLVSYLDISPQQCLIAQLGVPSKNF
jgi:hypothetical protein